MPCVQSASSCLMSYVSSPSPENIDKEELKSRFCLHWQMLPGMIALAATVVATVCSILCNSSSLCFLYIPGSLASLYLIYLGWNYQNLRTFAQNNEIMESKLNVFEEQNTKLKESNDKLGELVENLNSENLNLADSNKKLKETSEGLENLKNTLDVKAGAHIEQLNGLHSSLVGLEMSAEANHVTFGENLKIFIKQIEELQKAKSCFEEAGTEVEKKMRTQIELQLGVASKLEGIFNKINEWKDDKEVERRIKHQQKLKKKVAELSAQLGKNEVLLEEQAKQIKEIAAIRDEQAKQTKELAAIRDEQLLQIKEQNQQIKELGEIKQDFNVKLGALGVGLAEFLSRISEMGAVVKELKDYKEGVAEGSAKELTESKYSELAKKADEIMKNYALLLKSQPGST